MNNRIRRMVDSLIRNSRLGGVYGNTARSAKSSRADRNDPCQAGRAVFEPLEARQLLTSIVVTSAADDGGPNTLRGAIAQANRDFTQDVITFAIPAVAGVVPTIQISATQGPLPAIVAPGVTIDGTSEWNSKTRTPLIHIDGSAAGLNANGLVLAPGTPSATGGETIRGLTITGFSLNGIEVQSSNNIISDNRIGTDGIQKIKNAGSGIFLNGTSFDSFGKSLTGNVVQNNIIGADSTTGYGGNVISGNNVYGVFVNGSTATGNAIYGNFIGTDATGQTKLANGGSGIEIQSPSSIIGGDAAGQGNLLSGNGDSGITLNGAIASGTLILGNYIGTDSTGKTALENFNSGIVINSADNTIGDTSGGGNVISGNIENGIQITGNNAGGNLINGNIIGADVTGENAIANGFNGIILFTSGNQISNNQISGNHLNGIYGTSGSFGDLITNNNIGLDKTGTKAIGNILSGILLDNGSDANTIGGSSASEGNVISGNGVGVTVNVQGTTAGFAPNVLWSNLIGTNAAGTGPVGNGYGLVLDDAVGTQVGLEVYQSGSGIVVEGAGNTISGNRNDGILLKNGSNQVDIIGDYIGTNSSATAAVNNGNDGINSQNATKIQVGPKVFFSPPRVFGAANIISGNGNNGIEISGPSSKFNVWGNKIGTDIVGNYGIGNAGSGVLINNATNNSIGDVAENTPTLGALQSTTVPPSGTTGSTETGTDPTLKQRNIISGNSVGVTIEGQSQSGNTVYNNYIGLDVSGTVPVPDYDPVSFGTWTTVSGSNTTIQVQYLSQSVTNYQGRTVTLKNAGGQTLTGRIVSATAVAGGFQLKLDIVADPTYGFYQISWTGNSTAGVLITNTTGAVVGGATVAQRNVISGNGDGVLIKDPIASGMSNVEAGVWAAPPSGTSNFAQTIQVPTLLKASLAQTYVGYSVILQNPTSGQTVTSQIVAVTAVAGGAYQLQLSANVDPNFTHYQIVSNTSGNTVTGNYIGTDFTGTQAVDGSGTLKTGNTLSGIDIQGSPNNTIGNSNAPQKNISSGNGTGNVISSWIGSVNDLTVGDTYQLNFTYVGTSLQVLYTVQATDTTAVAIASGILGAINAAIAANSSDPRMAAITAQQVSTLDPSTNTLTGTNQLQITFAATGRPTTVTTSGSPTLSWTNVNEVFAASSGALDPGSGITIDGGYSTGNSILGNRSGISEDLTPVIVVQGVDLRQGTFPVISTAPGERIRIANGSTVPDTTGTNGTFLTYQPPTKNNPNPVQYLTQYGPGVDRSFFINNDGVADLNITSVTFPNQQLDAAGKPIPIHFTIIQTLPAVLAPGQSAELIIHMDADALNVQNQVVKIVTNDPNNPTYTFTIGGDVENPQNIPVPTGYTTYTPPSPIPVAVPVQFVGGAISISTQEQVGNYGDGLNLTNSASKNIIGNSSAANTFSHNAGNGIHIQGSSTTNNIVQNNNVGTSSTGDTRSTIKDTLPLDFRGNALSGIYLDLAGGNTIGGSAAGTINVISRNIGDGILISGGGSNDNVIQNNYIGLDRNGVPSFDPQTHQLMTLDEGNNGNGIQLQHGAYNNIIGGSDVSTNNVISNNVQNGIWFNGDQTSGNTVTGNYIGVDAKGVWPLSVDYGNGYINDNNTPAGGTNFFEGMGVPSGNGGNGVLVDDVDSNTVGGPTASAGTGLGNVIEANAANGVYIRGATHTSGDNVFGNLIEGNVGSGVLIESANNTVGGIDNTWTGQINDTTAGDSIGLTVAYPDGTSVTFTYTIAAGDKTITQVAAGLINAISTAVAANPTNTHYIGTSAAQTDGRLTITFLSTNLPSTVGTVGSWINTSAGNVLGVPEDNLITTNGNSGIYIHGVVATTFVNGSPVTGIITKGNRVLNNEIEGQIGAGITIDNASNNFIGSSTGGGNLITSNDNGIVIVGLNSTGNQIFGNHIGTDGVSTSTFLGNARSGISISSPDNIIGGPDLADGNVISGNNGDGILLTGTAATGNVIGSNKIGTDDTGKISIGNHSNGIFVVGVPGLTIGYALDSKGNVISRGNLISGNYGAGVYISGAAAVNNSIWGNTIGTDIADNVVPDSVTNGVTTFGLGNRQFGVRIDSANNRVGGLITGEGNLIAGNLRAGVYIFGPIAVGNSILGNPLYSNGRLGIELGTDVNNVFLNLNSSAAAVNAPGTPGVSGTPGPNNFQNFPVIDNTAGSVVNFHLDTLANTNYRVELYSSTDGEAKTLLGFAQVVTDSAGHVSSKITLSAGVTLSPGELLTLTATRATDATYTSFLETSEISNIAPVLTKDVGNPLTSINTNLLDSANTGTLVSTLTNGIAGDQDTPLTSVGIAIVGVADTNGKYQYNDPSVGGWTDIPVSVSPTSALLLAPTSLVRFIPNQNYIGAVTGGIVFKAWDEAQHNSGDSGVDTTQTYPNANYTAVTNGSVTDHFVFSATTATSSVTVIIPPPVVTNFSVDTGTLGDHITSDHRLIFTGTGVPGLYVNVFLDGVQINATPVPVNVANSTWTYDYSSTLIPASKAGSPHVVTAVSTDNGSPTANVSVSSAPFNITILDPVSVFGGNPPTTPIANGDTSFSITDGTDFGAVSVDASNIIHTFTITNNGDVTSTINSVTVDNVGAFIVVPPDGATDTLKVGASTTFTVALRANSGLGNQIGTISIGFNSTSGVIANPYTFKVKGLITPSAPKFTSISVDTANPTDQITVDQNITLKGTAVPRSIVTLYRTDQTAPIGNAIADATSGIWSIPDPNTLAPGTYTYYATAQDPNSGTISANSAAFVVQILAPVSVTGTNGTQLVNGQTTTSTSNGTSFGPVSFGTVQQHVFTITNTSGVNINISSVSLPRGFTLASPITNVTLTPNQTLGITVQVDTSAFGNHAGILTINYQQGPATATDPTPFAFSGTFTFQIDATVVPPPPVITGIIPDTSSSDPNTPNRDITVARNISLIGTASPLTIIKITLVGTGIIGAVQTSPTGQWKFDYTSTTLAIGTYIFTATATDPVGETSLPSQPLTVVISDIIGVEGNGLLIPNGTTTTSATNLTDFGTLSQNGSGVIHTFQISNVGNVNLTINSVNLPTGFTLLTSVSNVVIGAGGTFNIAVRLDANSFGTKSGNLVIQFNQSSGIAYLPGAQYQFAISGQVATDDNGHYVNGLFQLLLGRSADDQAVDAFTPILDNARLAALNPVASAIVNSQEAYTQFLNGPNGLYEKFLGRQGSAAEVSFYLGVLSSGSTYEQVMAAFAGSAEYYNFHGGTDTSFVLALYQNILGRPADTASLNVFVGLLGAARRALGAQGQALNLYTLASTRAEIANYLLQSVEYRTLVVTNAYRNILNRAPDTAGLNYWVSQLSTGARDQSIWIAFYSSAEFFTNNGNTTESWVKSLYTMALGRSVDSGGLTLWVNQVLNGYLAARTSVATAIVQSDEYIARTILSIYIRYLGRGAAQPELNGWVFQIKSGVTYQAVTAQIIGSTEYYMRNGNTDSTWVSRAFADVLGRPIDTGSLNAFLGLLKAGQSRSQVAGLIVNSTEASIDFVNASYLAMLGHIATPDVVQVWLAQFAAGVRNDQLIAAVAATNEEYLKIVPIT